MIEHKLTHVLQPTNNSCSQTALSMLLQHYKVNMSPQEIMDAVPVEVDEHGEPWGTITQGLATWCIGQGFDVTMWSYDFEILDLNWKDLSSAEIAKRLRPTLEYRVKPFYGKHDTQMYINSYLSFIEAGGELIVQDYPSSAHLDELVEKAPVFISVNSNVLNGSGRARNTGEYTSEPDVKEGRIINHSVVLNGVTESGDYIIMDPWKQGRREIERDRLLGAITAAHIESDNLIFALSKK